MSARLAPALLLFAVLVPAVSAQPTLVTTLYGDKKENAQKKGEVAIKEIAGTAEFLRAVPKKFATLKGVDTDKHMVILRIEGESEDRTWPLTPDAEIKMQGWWGRLSQFGKDARVWAWFHIDRAKKPVAIFMLADEPSEQAIHGKIEKARADEFELSRAKQQAWLRTVWAKEGLPGAVSLLQVYNGEADVVLDHEAMRWARSLKRGDKVELAAEPPIKGVVKTVSPQREKTQVRLVIKSFDLADLKMGQRVRLKMPTPSAEVQESLLPPDIDAPRTKAERIEWFLANIYCTCGVGGDGCTGHFYTLSSCNPNACGAPTATRKLLGQKIDEGLTDRQIFEQLLKERGPMMLRPHLLP
jgi:hypothetical protein